MYEKDFRLTDGTVLSGEEVNKINDAAIYEAVRFLANQKTQTANKTVAKKI